MVTIPQGQSAAEAEFSIVVVVIPTWWKTCAASYIFTAIVTWESSCETVTVETGKGLMPEVKFYPSAERICNQTGTHEEIGEDTVVVKVGERRVKLSQTTRYTKYLNLEISGLANEKQKVGGILGLDEHGSEAEVPEECKARKRHISEKTDRVSFSSTEDDVAAAFLSFARVI